MDRIITENLILRRFTEDDMESLFEILKDEEVNKFLPWFPAKNMEDTKKFFDERYKDTEKNKYSYAICLKEDNKPIGYIGISTNDSYDLGYGLRKEYWNRGIVTEVAKAMVEVAKENKLPYITATHDVNNIASGKVMQKINMEYKYSYKEQCQPKDILVTFRMYQLNLDGNKDRTYSKYLEISKVHFVEKLKEG